MPVDKSFIEAITLIREKHPDRKPLWAGKHLNLKDIVGHIKCPKCGGRLDYSISGYNNHIHGKCETDGCLGWMM